MRIAVDVMGGDFGPGEVIAGALSWLEKETGASVILVGAAEQIEPVLKEHNYDPSRLSVVNATQVIGMEESPAIAMRRKKDASIVVATGLVKSGQADAILSCGSTGAQMAAALFILGRMEGIERPPIVGELPNISGSSSLLIDVGANVDCRPSQLVQFAALGSAYAAAILAVPSPRVGLLNNGLEETKGNAAAVEAFALLRQQPRLNFIGNVEGRDILAGNCDVIVCDGFTGNILLKSMEGLVLFLAQHTLKELGKLPAIYQKVDYRQVGGAPLLGVKGISVVCHGSSKRQAVHSGMNIAAQCIKSRIVEQQETALAALI
ncbi:MAG: phosphate acyltransferase PlsX [Syntrophomonadaceae bacterium]|jgi:glycerol-3-phosphate acyltransferase PlsX|nr:phosphate acyltransferase PlsX [Syntrophomonadaceae bacterium]